MEEIANRFTGTWIHCQDDHLPPFYDAVGTQEEEKTFMMSTTPKISYEIKEGAIHICTIPHPESSPEDKGDVAFKLGEEINVNVFGHSLKVRFEWEKDRLVQHNVPEVSHTLPHTVEHFVDKNNQLAQMTFLTCHMRNVKPKISL